MNTEVQQHAVVKEARPETQHESRKSRHELARKQIVQHGKGMRTSLVAGLLALVGLSAWLLA